MPALCASPSAYRVALRRAAHQIFDRPLILDDPLALQILTPMLAKNPTDLRAPQRPSSRALRAYLVARARFHEDTVCAARAEGLAQCILLGAGLDTFAYRPARHRLHMVEVDAPAAQVWKRQLLEQSGIPEPENLRFVPADLEHAKSLEPVLAQCLPCAPALVSLMGVLPYLSKAAFVRILQWTARLGTGTRILLDYRLCAETLPAEEQQQLASLAARTSAAGEAFRHLLSPEQMRHLLHEHGFRVTADVGTSDLNALYFSDRTDGLAIAGTSNRLIAATSSG